MVGFERIGKPFPLEHWLGLLRRQNRDKEKDANALRPCGVDFGVMRGIGLPLRQLFQGGENRAADVRKGHIYYDQAPDAARDLRHGVGGQRYDSYAPTLGIEDVFERALAHDVVVDDQDSDFGHVGGPRIAFYLCLSANPSSISRSPDR